MPPSTDPNHPNRRAFLGSLMAASLLTTGCWRGRYFDIEWDEEVELHNGRIIIVHIKRTFERVTASMRRSRWKGVLRATEISFNAGGQIGFYKKKFENYDVNFIHSSYGNWYIALTGSASLNKKEIVKEKIPVFIIFSKEDQRAAKSWKEVPHFPNINIMPVTPNSEGVSKFNNKTLTIPIKMSHWKKFPRAAGDNGKTIKVSEQQPSPN